MKCKFCNRKIVTDEQGHYFSFLNEAYLRSGICVGVGENGKVYILSSDDLCADKYFPKYCPECGRRLA